MWNFWGSFSSTERVCQRIKPTNRTQSKRWKERKRGRKGEREKGREGESDRERGRETERALEHLDLAMPEPIPVLSADIFLFLLELV